jgi:hypothetical protein
MCSLLWDKAAGREAHQSLPSSVEVKNGGTIPPLFYTSSWHVYIYMYLVATYKTNSVAFSPQANYAD